MPVQTPTTAEPAAFRPPRTSASARGKPIDQPPGHPSGIDMFDSESWPFANLLTLSERIGPQAPLGMLHEADRLAVKMQVSGQRRHQHVSGCTFDLVPPAGFEPARAAPEAVALYSSDLPKRTSRCSARARIGHNPPSRDCRAYRMGTVFAPFGWVDRAARPIPLSPGTPGHRA